MTRILQYSVMLLVSLVGGIVAVAEGGPIAGATIPLAIATLFFVDRKRTFSISAQIGALLGLLAFIAATVEFFSDRIDSPLLAGGHLLTYLVWVVLLQRKSDRHYWLLMSLTILQMSVAAVLTNAFWFGPALMVYTVLTMWTLTVFLIQRASSDLAASNRDGVAGPGATDEPMGRVWNTVTGDTDGSVINPRLAINILLVGFLSLGMSVAFFLLTPRIWMNPYSLFNNSTLAGQRDITGFSEEVRLGDMGEILENADPAMSVKLYHSADETLFSQKEYEDYLGLEPLFRGAVLEDYGEGRWARLEFEHLRRSPYDSPAGIVLQKIELRPMGTPIVFCQGDVVSVQPISRFDKILLDPYGNEFLRPSDSVGNRDYSYNVYSTAAPPDSFFAQQRKWWWHNNPASSEASRYRARSMRTNYEAYLARLTRFPQSLSELQEIAKRVIDDPEAEPREAARRLVSWLRDSGEFSYSLKRSVSDPEIDPILDFVKNLKQGHCEYFASSLAMLLRTVDLPSRVITGFKGGVYSESTRAFHVQQLHAHSWVEVFIDGQWEVLDPTPATRNASVSNRQSHRMGFRAYWTSLKTFWQFSIRLSKDQQEQVLYEPLAAIARDVASTARKSWKNPAVWLENLADFIRSPRRWFSWEGGAFAAVLMLLLSGIVWLLRRLVSWIRYRQLRSESADDRLHRVAFYERFRQILRRNGLTQGPSQTAREFAEMAGTQLQTRLASNDSLHAVRLPELAEAFYRIRFGNEQMDDREARELDRRLTLLEESLKPRREYGQ